MISLADKQIMEDNLKQKTEEVVNAESRVFSARLEALISSALQKGVLKEQEIIQFIEKAIETNNKENTSSDDITTSNGEGYYIKDGKKTIIPKSTKVIKKNAFCECKTLQKIVLPSNLTAIEDYAFYECENLTEVDFSQCDKLESIGIAAFCGCEELTEIDFSNCTSLEVFYTDALQDCNNLRIIDFSGCSNLCLHVLYKTKNNLKKLILPPGQEVFNEMFFWDQVDASKCNNVKVVYNEAFKDMEIKEIVIPDTVERIGKNAFDKCENLKTIVMPASLKELKGTLGNCMEQLKKIDFSKVKNLNTIPKKFIGYGCPKLKELIIPYGVTEIEDDAFKNAYALKRLFLPPTLKTIGDLMREDDEDYPIRTGLSVFCYSPSLEELEPIVYGWDDEEDLEEEEEEENDGNQIRVQKKTKINLYILPQYLDKYIAQRKAERIPEDVLIIQEIPDEFQYYYDN